MSTSVASEVHESSIDLSRFARLRSSMLMRVEGRDQDGIVIRLSEHGQLTYHYRMHGDGTPTSEQQGIYVTWSVPTDLHAESLRDLIHEHLNLLETVHSNHVVVWDGQNMSGELGEDGRAAADEFGHHLSAFASDSRNYVEEQPARIHMAGLRNHLIEASSTDLYMLVREAVHDGRPFPGEVGWVMVDVDEALRYARGVRARTRKHTTTNIRPLF